jgi:cytochrome c-type biogenesis protein CcsB
MMLSYAGLLVGSLMSITYVVIYITTNDTVVLKQQKRAASLPANLQPLSETTAQAFPGESRKSSAPVLTFCQESGTVLGTEFAFSVNTSFPVEDMESACQHDTGGVSNFKNVRVTNILNIFDNISYRTIGIGFCFLTLGILSGAVWANETWGSYWSWDPKETWALITWLTFAVYLHMRFLRGWVGIKPAWIASLGFVLIWVCYLGVNLLGKGLHSYGFFT